MKKVSYIRYKFNYLYEIPLVIKVLCSEYIHIDKQIKFDK